MDNFSDHIEEFQIRDETISAILMHRDAHFGGNFEVMVDYYANEGKGVSREFSLEKILELSALEKKAGENLAALILTGAELEEVARARDAYKRLKEVYESKSEADKYARLIADLILSEHEDPAEEIDTIVAEKSAIVPALIKLISDESFYLPLYPGYGLAPQLAMRCLERIGDKRAIYALFECIGRREVFEEERAIQALRIIGAPAQEFLVNVLKSRPITEDNERAAIALLHFKEMDSSIPKLCLEMLEDDEVKGDLRLAPYLILGCEGLESAEEKDRFKELFSKPKISPALEPDVQHVLSTWKRQKS